MDDRRRTVKLCEDHGSYSDKKEARIPIIIPFNGANLKFILKIEASFEDSISINFYLDKDQFENYFGIELYMPLEFRAGGAYGTYAVEYTKKSKQELINWIENKINVAFGKLGKQAIAGIDRQELDTFISRCSTYDPNSSGDEEPLSPWDVFDSFKD